MREEGRGTRGEGRILAGRAMAGGGTCDMLCVLAAAYSLAGATATPWVRVLASGTPLKVSDTS